MSWYVEISGRQVWVDREETVLTVGDAPEEQDLRMENLAYLAATSSKAVYAEHIIDDGLGDKKGKRAKEKAAGRQRGYVVRVETDARTRVVAPMQRAADRLIELGIVSRIDVDDEAAPSRRRAKEQQKAPEEEVVGPLLGANECRVETRARIQHFAHGQGFQVEVLQPGTKQRLQMFTSEKELPVAEWHRHLVAAIEHSGRRVAIGRMACEDGPAGNAGGGGRGIKGIVQQAPAKKDEAQQDDEDWLNSVLGRCMVSKTKKSESDGSPGAEGAGEGEASPPPAAEKKKRPLPPWLQR